MKTAMQEWIEWLKAYEYELPLELQIKAKQALEKEKMQIIDAHADGADDLNFNGQITERGLKNAEYYYNQTFNQNK